MKSIRCESSQKWRRLFWRLLIVLIVVWLLGDLAHSCFVALRLQVWENSKSRDANGVLRDCEAFSLGDGRSAVLMIHGINASPYDYRKMAPRLADSGVHVRAMRLPGFAEPIANYGSYSTDDWVASVKCEVARLRESHDRVFIVAHSLGGAISLRYLIENPGQVDGVVLLAPVIDVSNNRSPLLPTRAWHRLSKGLLFTRIVTAFYDNDSQDLAERDKSHQTSFTPRKVIDQTCGLIDFNRGSAEKIETPLLMYLSRNDNVIDWIAAESFYNRVHSPQKQLLFNDRSGHPLPFDFGWDQVTDDIAAFIRQVELAAESKEPAQLTATGTIQSPERSVQDSGVER